MGLKLTLSIMNKGCGPKRQAPEFLRDDTWKRTGGDGNFLLSTRFGFKLDGMKTDNKFSFHVAKTPMFGN